MLPGARVDLRHLPLATLLTAAFAAAMLLLAAVVLVTRLSSPWDGTEWQPHRMGDALTDEGWTVRPVDPRSEVRPGETVTHVNGTPVDALTRSPFDFAGPLNGVPRA